MAAIRSAAGLSKRVRAVAGLLVLSAVISGNSSAQSQRPLAGPYLGQAPPGPVPQIFAPGIVSTPANEHGCTFSPHGTELYFTRIIDNRPTIMVTRLHDSAWSQPSIASFSGTFTDRLPSLSPDGNTLYFESIRPRPYARGESKHGHWFVTRAGSDWDAPEPLVLPTTARLAGLWAAADGSLYLRGIVRLDPTDSGYTSPQRLGTGIDGDYPFVTPDESLLLLCVPPRRDLAISRRLDDGSWSTPRELLTDTRPGWIQGFPILSPCGHYLFFTADHDIYWVSFEAVTSQ